uniref:transposase n=1 Tax=Serratia liquefaciens TaxID=614 RepID=UPI0038D5190B
MSASKLRHYSGGAVVHHYYDHRTQQHRQQTLTQEEMIGRYISHVPAKHFKMVRYYGFLSNRKRGALLPKVYEALKMAARKKPEKPGFAALMKGFVGTDPYKCILCGDRLRFAGAQAGFRATELLSERLNKMEQKRWLRAQALGQSA